MLASWTTLLGRELIVSLSCWYSAPAFFSAARGCVMVKARDSSRRDDGNALQRRVHLIWKPCMSREGMKQQKTMNTDPGVDFISSMELAALVSTE